MLAHIPLWVFAVFALLLALGVLLSRPRAVHPIAPLLVAAGFMAYALWGAVSAFGASLANVVPWAAGLLASVLLGGKFFGPTGLTRSGASKVLVPGSWLPLALMMGIFFVKFVVGFARGTHLALAEHALFAPVACAALGCLSGGFVARGLNVHRFVKVPANNA